MNRIRIYVYRRNVAPPPPSGAGNSCRRAAAVYAADVKPTSRPASGRIRFSRTESPLGATRLKPKTIANGGARRNTRGERRRRCRAARRSRAPRAHLSNERPRCCIVCRVLDSSSTLTKSLETLQIFPSRCGLRTEFGVTEKCKQSDASARFVINYNTSERTSRRFCFRFQSRSARNCFQMFLLTVVERKTFL